MIRTIEKLSHLSVIGMVILFFLITYLLLPLCNIMVVCDFKIAISIALLVAAFVSSFIIFRQLLGFLLISFLLLVIIIGFITRSILDSFFFSSIAIATIVLLNIIKH